MDRKALDQDFDRLSDMALEEAFSFNADSGNEGRIKGLLFAYSHKVQELIARTEDGLVSLDLGCGTSDRNYAPHWANYLALVQQKLSCNKARTVGIDVSTDTSGKEQFELHAGPAYDLTNPEQALEEFDDASFDLVTNMFCLPQDPGSARVAPALRKALEQRIRAHALRRLNANLVGLMAEELHKKTYLLLKQELIRVLKDGGTYIEDDFRTFTKKGNQLHETPVGEH